MCICPSHNALVVASHKVHTSLDSLPSRVLETKLTEARSKKDTLKARAASAKTSQQIQVRAWDQASNVAVDPSVVSHVR